MEKVSILQKIDDMINYLIEEIKQNELIRKKDKKSLNCIEYSIILASTVTGCVTLSAFASLVGIPIDSYFSHDEFVLITNMLKEYHDMTEGIKISSVY